MGCQALLRESYGTRAGVLGPLAVTLSSRRRDVCLAPDMSSCSKATAHARRLVPGTSHESRTESARVRNADVAIGAHVVELDGRAVGIADDELADPRLAAEAEVHSRILGREVARGPLPLARPPRRG